MIEVTGFLAGPFCGLQLATLGAEVIKIEAPGHGDASRQHSPFAGPQGIHSERRTPQDMSLSILKRAAGRRSVTLNLKHEQGRRIFRDLLRQADVLLENLRPGALQRLGLDYDSLQTDMPRLVYCSISGYGSTGPYSSLPAHDPIIQASSGLMSLIGPADGAPYRTGQLYLADLVAPLYASLAIVGALRQRDLTGQGQHLDVSMFDCLISLLWDEPYDYYVRQALPMRCGNSSARVVPMNTYPTQDGTVVILAASGEQWERLVRAMDREDLRTDPRCASAANRNEHRAFVDATIAAWTRQHTSVDIQERCRAHAVPCGAVRTMEEVMHDPHVHARGLLQPLRHPALPTPLEALAPRFPVRFSHSEVGTTTPAPGLGAETAQILHELLGYTPDHIRTLQATGVI